MSYQGIKFEDENDKYSSRVILGEPQTPRIITWIVKVGGGFVKTERQATYVLFVLVIISLIISAFLFFGGPGKQKAPKIMPSEYKGQLEQGFRK